MSLVWTPTIKRTMARIPGHLVSFIDAKRILPQKRAQRYQIAPIAMTPSGMPGNTPPEPYSAATIQVATVGRTCSLGSKAALIASRNISKVLVIAYGNISEEELFLIASAPRGSFLRKTAYEKERRHAE